MKKLVKVIVVTSTLIASTAFAGQAEDVNKCVETTKTFTGISLDEFNAAYDGGWITDEVRWNNVTCDIIGNQVYDLTVNGEIQVYRGFAGKDSYTLHTELSNKTNKAVQILENRISILKSRLDKAKKDLKVNGPDHASITEYIDNGINKATK